jgi:hypothetical protein
MVVIRNRTIEIDAEKYTAAEPLFPSEPLSEIYLKKLVDYLDLRRVELLKRQLDADFSARPRYFREPFDPMQRIIGITMIAGGVVLLGFMMIVAFPGLYFDALSQQEQRTIEFGLGGLAIFEILLAIVLPIVGRTAKVESATVISRSQDMTSR